MASNFSKLAPLFRGPFLRKVANDTHVSELMERLNHCGMSDLLKLPLWEIFEESYKALVEHYRCEYVFKNILTKQWFTSEHALNKSYITDEFRIGKSRVDLAVFAKSSFAFEIKTDFDSMARIGTQTSDYLKVFDFVYVVTSERFRESAIKAVPKTVGLLTLGSDGALEVSRQSESHGHFLDLKIFQGCLRQAEMLEIARLATGEKISVPNSMIFTECRKRFKQMLPFEAQKLFVEQLRARGYPAANVELLNDSPPSLKHAALTMRGTIQDINWIRKNLTKVPTLPKPNKSDNHDHILPIPARQTKRASRIA